MPAQEGLLVQLENFLLPVTTLALGEIARFNTLAQGLNRITGKRCAINDNLEAVIIARIMAPRQHHSGIQAFNVIRSEIQCRSRHHAHIDHMATGGADTVTQSLQQCRARQSAITGQGNAVLPLRQHLGTDTTADQVRAIVGECLVIDTANIIGPKNRGGYSVTHNLSILTVSELYNMHIGCTN